MTTDIATVPRSDIRYLLSRIRNGSAERIGKLCPVTGELDTPSLAQYIAPLTAIVAAQGASVEDFFIRGQGGTWDIGIDARTQILDDYECERWYLWGIPRTVVVALPSSESVVVSRRDGVSKIIEWLEANGVSDWGKRLPKRLELTIEAADALVASSANRKSWTL